MQVRRLQVGDEQEWLGLRARLWPETPAAQLLAELRQIAADERQAAIGAFQDGALVAFAELSLHPHAIGCSTGPVAYLEGWYVAPPQQRRGIGRRLLEAGQAWGRSQGCRELASDTWLDNEVSHAAHLALGFAEVRRMIHYRKEL